MTATPPKPVNWEVAPSWQAEERRAWKPPEDLTVSEWVSRHAFLDPLVNARGGRVNLELTPYTIEWMDCANASWVRQCTVMAGTQCGKTTSMNCVVGYAISEDPAPMMLVVPRTKDVGRASERRIMPMVKASPRLAAELTDEKHDAKIAEIKFRRAILYLSSAQSPADLASIPVRFVFNDEVDKYPSWAGKEASPIDLSRERQASFWNRINYVMSTPTTRDGVVFLEYEDGDKRRYYLPCVHCQYPQVLRFSQIRWPSTITTSKQMREAKDASYFCERCQVAIPDAAKREMNMAGVWVPERVGLEDLRGEEREKAFAQWRDVDRHKDRTDHRSYHIWAGYSPFLQWWELAAKFLYSKGKPARLQNWVNSGLAEIWEEKVDAPDTSAIARAQLHGFRLGEVPDGCLVAVGGADVQKDRIYYVVRGYGVDGETWLLAAGQCANFEELEDIFCRNVWAKKGPTGVRMAMIDSRYRRKEVFALSRARPQLKMAQGIKDRDAPVPISTKKLEKHPHDGTPLKDSVLLWSLIVSAFKDSLSAKMQNAAKWHLPMNLPDGYAAQVTSEQKVRVRRGAKTVELWVPKPGSAANHMWDCEVYAEAAASVVRVELLTDGDRPNVGTKSRPPRPKRGGGPPMPRLGR